VTKSTLILIRITPPPLLLIVLDQLFLYLPPPLFPIMDKEGVEEYYTIYDYEEMILGAEPQIAHIHIVNPLDFYSRAYVRPNHEEGEPRPQGEVYICSYKKPEDKGEE